jgi:integrase
VTLPLRAASGPKYTAAFATAYGAGLRVSEVVTLKVGDIDSERMLHCTPERREIASFRLFTGIERDAPRRHCVVPLLAHWYDEPWPRGRVTSCND